MSAWKRAGLADLQTVYRLHHDAAERLWIKLSAKYGGTISYASAGEGAKLAQLQSREDKAGNRIMAWLRANTRWNWYEGTSYHWLCTSLTEAQALSETAPTLPAEAAAYGYPARPYVLAPANPPVAQEGR